MNIEIINPAEIEKRSLEIIEEKLKGKNIEEKNKDIIKRVIHTTADFDYAENMIFSEDAADKALAALKNKVNIVTDTQMAFSGINKKILSELGCKIYCYMSDDDVAKRAKELGITRAMAAMEKAAELGSNTIFAIGNAPTALIKLNELTERGIITPVLIIAVAVGFVNVVEAKELIIGGKIPFIASRGNKGGSTVAAAILNALLYKLKKH